MSTGPQEIGGSGAGESGVSSTAFGESRVESLTPLTQISAHHGLLSNVLTVTDDGTAGSTSIVDNKFTCDSGATADGIASILTLRHLTYRSGQGALARFTALFDTPVAGSLQAAGMITSENSFVFGYVGEVFGIVHAYNGVDELQELTLDTLAGGGAETATITVNGIGYSVPLSGLGLIWQDAYEIAASLTSQVPNYTFSSNGSTVTAQAVIPGTQGAFAYTSNGTSSGTWAQIKAGTPSEQDFIPQTSWNRDTRISNSSDINLNHNLGNVYQIQLGYLGYGDINFYVKDKKSGQFILVHRIEYANANEMPSVSNPTFRIGWLSRNTGNTSSIRVQGASAGAFVEGKVVRDTPPRAEANDQLQIGNSPTLVMALRNRSSFNDSVNRIELYPLFVDVATQVNKVAFFEIRLNPTFDEPVNFSYVDKANSVAETAKDKVGVTGGRKIGTVTVTPGAGGKTITFNQTETTSTAVFAGSTIAIIAASGTAQAGDCQATITWQEDA